MHLCIYNRGEAVACQEKEGQMFHAVCLHWRPALPWSRSSVQAGALTPAPSSRALEGVQPSAALSSGAECPTGEMECTRIEKG